MVSIMYGTGRSLSSLASRGLGQLSGNFVCPLSTSSCQLSIPCCPEGSFDLTSSQAYLHNSPFTVRVPSDNAVSAQLLRARRLETGAVKGARRRTSGAAEAADEEEDIADADFKKKRERQLMLEAAMEDINNSFGKGSVMRLGSGAQITNLERTPTGCLTLDYALCGGFPKGRVIEIFGHESSGKTTLALHAIAEVQRAGGNAMLVDAEHAFDASYARKLGLDVDSLIICQPESGENALETVDRMCRSKAMDIIVIDSVSALVPRAEIEGEIGLTRIGLLAALMSQSLRKLAGNASKSGCTLIFLNQIRMKIGIAYGNPEVTSGGVALNFYASLRLEMRPVSGGKIKSPKAGEDDIGIRIRAKVVKSKVSKPYMTAEFDVIFGEGISRLGCVVDAAEEAGLLQRRGSWYSYGEQRIGQGRDRTIVYLSENPELADELEGLVLERSLEIQGAVGARARSGQAADSGADAVLENGFLDDEFPSEDVGMAV